MSVKVLFQLYLTSFDTIGNIFCFHVLAIATNIFKPHHVYWLAPGPSILHLPTGHPALEAPLNIFHRGSFWSPEQESTLYALAWW
jgi:uncharacterized membrane protein YoaT (DUF817 family)